MKPLTSNLQFPFLTSNLIRAIDRTGIVKMRLFRCIAKNLLSTRVDKNHFFLHKKKNLELIFFKSLKAVGSLAMESFNIYTRYAILKYCPIFTLNKL